MIKELIQTIETLQKEARDGMKRASGDSDPYLYQYMVGKFHAFGKVAWILKKLPSKKEQKPAEWSEEDEEKLKAICTYLRDYSRLVKLGDKLRFNEYCDFLESLRPQGSKDSLQTHWKPSEEQMDVLLNTEGMIRASGYPENAKVLASLYEALKKL